MEPLPQVARQTAADATGAVMRKKPEDVSCYRCSESRRLHIGDELKCPKPPRRYPRCKGSSRSNGPGVGDGCFRPYCRYTNRQCMSFNSHQTEFLDALLTMLTRGADVSILVRSKEFSGIRKNVSAAKDRAREAKEVAA